MSPLPRKQAKWGTGAGHVNQKQHVNDQSGERAGHMAGLGMDARAQVEESYTFDTYAALIALPVWRESACWRAGKQTAKAAQTVWLPVQPSLTIHNVQIIPTSIPNVLHRVCATRLMISSALHGPHPTRCPRHCDQPTFSSTTLPAPTATTLSTSPLSPAAPTTASSPISCSCLQQHL
jgi:hypothetical protein